MDFRIFRLSSPLATCKHIVVRDRSIVLLISDPIKIVIKQTVKSWLAFTGWQRWLLFLLSTTATISAQTLDFRNFTARDGLISDEVYNLFQDRQGYIWVFSKYGTLKYNGREFKPVLRNLQPRESFIFSVFERPDGRKWIANSKAQIYEIRNDSAILIRGIEKESEFLKNAVSEVYQLFVDDSLNITAVTKGIVYKFVNENGKYRGVQLNPFLEKQISVHTRIIEQGEHVFGCNVLYRHYEFVGLPPNLSVERVKTHHIIRVGQTPAFNSYVGFHKFGDRIYFRRDRYLCWIDEKDSLKQKDVGARIIKFNKDKNGHTFVGCLDNGLYEFDTRDSLVGHYLGGTTVNDVMIDNRDGLWVSTPDRGLFYCRDVSSRGFEKGHPLANTLSLIKRIDKNLFIATTRGAIYKVVGDSLLNVRVGDNNPAVDVIRYGNKYLSLHHLLYEISELSGKKHALVKATRQGRKQAVFQQSADTLIFIWSRGLSFNVNEVELKSVDFKEKIFAAAFIRDTVWLGTARGAFFTRCFFDRPSRKEDGVMAIGDVESLAEIPWLSAMKGIPINKIVDDRDGGIWFCTDGEGVFYLRNRQILHYTVLNGLPSNIVNNISFADDHSAILSTNKGLFVSVRGKDFKQYSVWKNMFKGDIKNAVCNGNKIYISTKDGLVIINTNKAEPQETTFFNLLSIRADSLQLRGDGLADIPYNAGNLTFRFDLVNFDDIRPPYKYKLTGPVIDSGLANNPSLTLKRLPPGAYTLTAFPLIKNGVQQQIAVPFIIQPAIWQTIGFKIIVTFLVLLLTVLIVRRVVRYNNEKEAVRQKNEQMIEEYKLIALKAQVNPHFISNCLAAIQSIIFSGNMDSAAFYIARFGLMVRQILDLSSRAVVSLQEELDVLQLYLEMEQLRFNFKYNIHIDDEVIADETYVPSLLLNPIVENAIWHGLMTLKKTAEKELIITVKAEDNKLMISVRDNGAGREPEITPAKKRGRKSYGLQITAQRLANINNLYHTQEAAMVMNDLKHENGNGIGTEVIIYLPFNLTPSTS